jgi:DNA replication protein DnaC
MVSSAKNAQTAGVRGHVRRRACFTGRMTDSELLEPAAARAANPHLRGLGSSSCPYGECDGNGLVLQESGDASPCRCRAERIARNRTRGLHDTIPERYRDVAFDRAPVNQMEQHTVRHIRRFCERIESKLDDGKGFFFFGDRGTGKTTLAMLIAQHALKARRTAAIYPVPWLLSQIRSTYEQDAQHSYVGLMERLAAVDLLQLDDMAVASQTDWTLEQLYTIVNRRYEDRRSVVVTAELDSHEKLGEHIGHRTASRLFEMCETIPLFGPDKRLSAAPEA